MHSRRERKACDGVDYPSVVVMRASPNLAAIVPANARTVVLGKESRVGGGLSERAPVARSLEDMQRQDARIVLATTVHGFPPTVEVLQIPVDVLLAAHET